MQFEMLKEKSSIIIDEKLQKNHFVLATIHRQENTDDEDMDWVANPFAEAESQFNDMQRDFGDGKISDNNSNAAENYKKRKDKLKIFH